MNKPTGQRLPLNALLSKPLRDRPRTTSLGPHATSVPLYMDYLKFGPIGLRKKHEMTLKNFLGLFIEMGCFGGNNMGFTYL